MPALRKLHRAGSCAIGGPRRESAGYAVRIEVADDLPAVSSLEAEWEALLGDVAEPSIYMTFDFQLEGWKAFHRDTSTPFVVVGRDGDGRIAGIAPLRAFRDRRSIGRWRTLAYLTTFEVDRPRPIARRGREGEFWRALAQWLDAHPQRWNVLELRELPADQLPHAHAAFAPVRARMASAAGSFGIGIDLRRPWSEFIAAHSNTRKRTRQIERQKPDLEIRRYDGPTGILEGLALYSRIERASWKAERIGVTRDARHEAFYAALLPRLAARGRATIRILRHGDELVAGELTYELNGRVFFAQSVYNEAHAGWRPGTFLAVQLLRDYMDRHYDWGDYLAGYADYLRPWCGIEWPTATVRVTRDSWLMRMSGLVKATARPVAALRGSR